MSREGALGCPGLLGQRGLGVMDNFPPGIGICRCLTAPAGLSRRCPPTQDLRPALTRGVHSHSPMAQLPLSPPVLYLPPGLALERRWDSRSCHQGWHTLAPPAPFQGPRARAAAPLPWHLPRGTGCAWDPPSWPHISCQVFSNKYSRAMQGGSWDPPHFQQPLHPSWNCCPRGDPPPASAPRPVPARQQLLLNQRRGPGCARGDRWSPCSEAGGEPRASSPAWGHLDPEGWQEGNDWGCRGSWKDPSFPEAREGSLGVLVTRSPPLLRGVLYLSPCPPCATQPRHVPPWPWVPRGARHPLPGCPGSVPSCAVPCHALPRCLGGHLSHIPCSTSRWDPQVRRPRGSVTAACACLLPCSPSRRKKSNGNSLV